MPKVEIQFEGQEPPVPAVLAEPGAPLSDVLDGPHSPVFFGCKSGNCGTCLVELNPEVLPSLPPPNETELEILTTMAADRPHARLACQLSVLPGLRLRYLN